MNSAEYEIPDVTVVNDFTIIYKSQEEREGQLYDSIEEIKTSKDQFLRKLRFFKNRWNEIYHMKSILIEENYPKAIFKEFISTLTTNKICLNEHNYTVLLELSSKYQYPELQNQVLKFSSSRPDIKLSIDEILQNEEEEKEEDYLKEEIIVKHLDISLRNDNMLNFPIRILIRILNSPKRNLNDHHLLYEFIKKFILNYEKKTTKKSQEDEDNVQILLSALDYSQMSIDELKELFNSKHFTSTFNCRGTKEQMTKFITEIENQDRQIKEMMIQIEKQKKIIDLYEIENRKNKEILESYESRMKMFEESMNKMYKNESLKQQKNYEMQLERIKNLEEQVLKKQKEERNENDARIKKLGDQILNKQKEETKVQETKIKNLEEQIVSKQKKEIKSQEERIKKIEYDFHCFLFYSLDGEITASLQQDRTIKGVIKIHDDVGILDKSRSKYLLNTDSSPKIGSSSYEKGAQISNLVQEVKFERDFGKYYLHVLLTDSLGRQKELVSQAVTKDKIEYKYKFTGKAEAVTLPPGRYKLEVWGAEGGKNGKFYNYSGKGGYSVGTLTLVSPTKLYIHVGESPNSMNGGWNGGGSGSVYNSYVAAGGGGSTDISFYGEEGSSNWNNQNHLYSRIIVAGAGGGSSLDSEYPNWYGGCGGGVCGQRSGFTNSSGDEGTQTKAGNNISCSKGQGFGVGGGSTCGGSSGGGGGWYGGCASGRGNHGCGGSGGSGYVYNSSTATNYPNGCKLNSSFYLTDSSTISGGKNIPNPLNGSTEKGHSGHGYARITLL